MVGEALIDVIPINLHNAIIVANHIGFNCRGKAG